MIQESLSSRRSAQGPRRACAGPASPAFTGGPERGYRTVVLPGYRTVGHEPPPPNLTRYSLADLVMITAVPRKYNSAYQRVHIVPRIDGLVYAGHVEQGQPRAEGIPPIGHLLEESSCPKRFCCGEMRSFRIPLRLGDKDGQEIIEYTKPWSFPICFRIRTDNGNLDIPCCCFLPKLETKLPDGTFLGSTEYYWDMYCFVPKFRVRDRAGTPVYRIAPDTCCGNCCVLCGGGGAGSKCLFIPFYIRDHDTSMKLQGALPGTQAEIRKVWSGFKKELCTTADNFQVLALLRCLRGGLILGRRLSSRKDRPPTCGPISLERTS
eukprot:753002-Hanusia_phi.AAC.1